MSNKQAQIIKNRQKNAEQAHEDLDEGIVFDGEDIHDTQVVKKLRARLRACEQEKKEYLDGWQRARADLLNNKKEARQKLEEAGQMSRDALASELLAVLDSFDMAFKGSAWSNVDSVWQKGVEYIHTQLLDVLKAHDIEQFGRVGDKFDPNMHEATKKQTDEGEKTGTILEVLQSGYKTKNKIIRPARVVVAT